VATEMEEEPGMIDPVPGESLPGAQALVRAAKHVVMRTDDSATYDAEIVTPLLYNNFHYALLPRTESRTNFVFGVTSTRDGDGKTVVAANLAVSMAIADERETVLVDLNMRNPRLHSVFALGIGPGLAEALSAPMVQVARTTVRHLHVMTLGNISATFSGIVEPPPSNGRRNGKKNGKGKPHAHAGTGAMTGLPSFRHVMESLKQRFEVIIFDLPSVTDPILPMNLTRQMDGVVFVVDSSRTTRDDITRVTHRLGKDRLLGFVLNRVTDAA